MSERELAVEMVNRFNLRTCPDRDNREWRCDRQENPGFFVVEPTWHGAVLAYVKQAVDRAAGVAS